MGAGSRSVLCPVLVGRDHELLGLRAALGDAKAGRGGVALVTGEAGVGKSRLVKDLEAAARQDGWTVLSGRATDGQAQLPFRALTEAFCSVFRTSGPPDAPELVPFRRVLGQVVPEWRQEDSVRNDDFVVVLGEAVSRLLRVIAGAADGRCLLVLEDLHWADPDTVTVLEYLVDNLDAAPVLCLGTLRIDQRSPALGLASSLSARRACPVFGLERLGAADTTRMARACLDTASLPEELEAALWTWTEGIPFLVEELLSAWMGSGALSSGANGWSLEASVAPVVPAGLDETVRLRLQDLGTDGQGVLSAAAVLGRAFDVDLLPAMTGLDAPTLLRVLRSGVAAQLLRCETSPQRPAFSFRHALTRDAVLGQLLPPERVELYRRALRAVEKAHPGLPGEWCERAAGLAEDAGHPMRAAGLLLESGLRALNVGALITAEATLERGRALAADHPSLVTEIDEVLAEVLALAAKTDRAVEVGVRLLSDLTGPPRLAPSRRAAVHLRLARVLLPSGDWPAVCGHLKGARRLAEEALEYDLLVAIDAVAAHVALGQGRLDEAAGLAETVLLRAEAQNLPEVACEALEVIGRRVRLRDLHEAEGVFVRARRIAERHGLTLWRIRAVHELALLDMLLRVRAERLQEARHLAYQAGALATAANLDLHCAMVLAFRFDAEEGLVAARRSAELARRLRLGLLLPMALIRQAECHAVAGDRTQMERAIALALVHGDSDPDVAAGAWGQCRALSSLLAENRGRALVQLDRAMGFVGGRPGTLPWVFRGLWVLVHAVEDTAAEAAQVAFEHSGVTARPIHRAFLGYARAVTLGRNGRPDTAADAFRMAQVDMELAGEGGAVHLARRLVAEAAIEDGWGDPVPWLQDAVRFFDRTGQERVGSACRSLLRRAGVQAPRRRRGGPRLPAHLASLGLTDREVEVLLLVADGLRNKEIAARLYLSPRTVHKHMQHLLAKTGSREREQLVGLALGLSAPAS